MAVAQNSPVWEITGAEFTKSDHHTAGGISIRFPRMTKMRDDKSWKEATDLPRLKVRVIAGSGSLQGQGHGWVRITAGSGLWLDQDHCWINVIDR